MTDRRSVLGPAGPALLLLVLVVLGVGLLYAYRAQSPATREIPFSDAVARVERGEVARVTVTGTRAALELRDSAQRLDTVVPDGDEALVRAVSERNRADPSHPVQLRSEPPPPILPLALSVLLSMLPVLLLVALVFLTGGPALRSLRRCREATR